MGIECFHKRDKLAENVGEYNSMLMEVYCIFKYHEMNICYRFFISGGRTDIT